MVIEYGIIKKEDVVDVFPYTYHGNNIPAGIGWVEKVDNCEDFLTAQDLFVAIKKKTTCHCKEI